MQEKKQLRGFPLTVNIYAYDEREVEEARKALADFISAHAKENRAVTAKKIAQAVNDWDRNPIIRSKIIKYFQ